MKMRAIRMLTATFRRFDHIRCQRVSGRNWNGCTMQNRDGAVIIVQCTLMNHIPYTETCMSKRAVTRGPYVVQDYISGSTTLDQNTMITVCSTLNDTTPSQSSIHNTSLKNKHGIFKCRWIGDGFYRKQGMKMIWRLATDETCRRLHMTWWWYAWCFWWMAGRARLDVMGDLVRVLAWKVCAKKCKGWNKCVENYTVIRRMTP